MNSEPNTNRESLEAVRVLVCIVVVIAFLLGEGQDMVPKFQTDAQHLIQLPLNAERCLRAESTVAFSTLSVVGIAHPQGYSGNPPATDGAAIDERSPCVVYLNPDCS